MIQKIRSFSYFINQDLDFSLFCDIHTHNSAIIRLFLTNINIQISKSLYLKGISDSDFIERRHVYLHIR